MLVAVSIVAAALGRASEKGKVTVLRTVYERVRRAVPALGVDGDTFAISEDSVGRSKKFAGTAVVYSPDSATRDGNPFIVGQMHTYPSPSIYIPFMCA